MSGKPYDTARNTVVFLRLAAAQLRALVKNGSGLGEGEKQQLHHIADQCEAEATELAKEFGIPAI